ncbi:hypothetical protein ACOME3_005927 [Neoechinorhynchus agilis]
MTFVGKEKIESSFFWWHQFASKQNTTFSFRLLMTESLSESSSGIEHIPLTNLQHLLLTIGSGAVCLLNPTRGNMIATFGEVTGQRALKSIRQRMMEDDNGRKILEEKPLITSKTVDLDLLSQLPPETFGNHYFQFLKNYNYSPDERRAVYFVDDPELAYVMLRYRQLHDLTHVILGQPTNLLGEIVVKRFEATQYALPMCILGSTFASWRLGPKHSAKYLNQYLPWVIQTAKRARLFINCKFEDHWTTPIDKLRRSLRVKMLD